MIAEGVETIEELSTLADLGCTKVQGYLVARPLDPDAVVEFVANYDTTLSFEPKPVTEQKSQSNV